LRFATLNYPAIGYKARMEKSTAQAAIRFGFGPGPNDAPNDDPVSALKAQLQGPDPGLASGQFNGLPRGGQAVDMQRADNVLRQSIMEQGLDLKANYHPQTPAAIKADADAQLAWAISTPASFRERLVWFWANHFSTSIQQNQCGGLIGPMLREAIRPNVTGNFTDMVLAVERHPAMLRYLDNFVSIGPDSRLGQRTHRGLNENLGRECMELHTCSLAAGYTQTDVTNMAKILTGWGIGLSTAGADATGFKYYPNWHEPGPQMVMGKRFDGGEQAGIDALTFLSTYPTTYRFIAQKLVTYFVADHPPPSAVNHIAGVLRDTEGDLGAASAALVDLPQAWVPGRKLKTPFDYVVSALRALPPPPDQPPVNPAGAMAGLGQPLWSAPLPNGWPDQAAAWDGSAAILARVNFAYGYTGRFGDRADGPQPMDVAHAALGPLLRPATASAIANAGSRREALTLLLTAPEFQRR
jgi:uncharacterized protein (DUF1800 family)